MPNKKQAAPVVGNATMAFTIKQSVFLRMAQAVSRAVDGKPPLPVLNNILLEARPEGWLTLTATNLELTIIASDECQVDGAGSVTLPAKTLIDIISTLNPQALVEFELSKESQLGVIRSGRSQTKINGISAAEFPPIAPLEKAQTVVLPAQRFCTAMRQTLYATGGAGSQQMMQGLAFYFEGDRLTLLAGDRQRIARAIFVRDESVDESFNLAIPARLLREVERIYADVDEPLTMSFGKKKTGGVLARFEAAGIVVYTQVQHEIYSVTGLERMLESHKINITVSAEALRQTLRRARIFAQDANNYARLTFGEDGIEVVGRSKERGETYDIVPAEITGGSLDIGENLNFLIDAIESFGSVESLNIRANAVSDALIFFSDERDGLIAAVSPMQRQD